MEHRYTEIDLRSALHERILNKQQRYKFLERLINAARVDTDLLKVSSCESIVFRIDPEHVEPLKSPKIDRLTLVFPESWEFDWQLSVTGYFLVKYKSLSQPLPKHIEPFIISYSGIIILDKSDIKFKNEWVQLI